MSEWLIHLAFDIAFFGALGVALVLVAAFVHSHLQWRARQRADGTTPVDLPAASLRQSFAAESIDVEAAIRDVLRCGDQDIARRLVQPMIAVQPGLRVRCDPQALHDVLGALLRHAAHAAPAGRVLFAALHHGGRVQVTVTHDGDLPGENSSRQSTAGASLTAMLRDAGALVALQGGTLEVPAGAPEGRSIVLRLPAPPDRTATPQAVPHAPGASHRPAAGPVTALTHGPTVTMS